MVGFGVIFTFLFISSCSAYRLWVPRSGRHHRLRYRQTLAANNPLFALKDGAYEKIRSLRTEYESLKGSNGRLAGANGSDSASAERVQELKVIMECSEALQTIEADLQLFSEQLESTDASIKSSAISFTQEFQECKEQIENQLNAIL